MIVTAALPAPIADNWQWQSTAACREINPEVFFLPENARGSSKRMREAAAKAVCARCPIRLRCLDWALTVGEAYGVWGGMTPQERARIDQPRQRSA
jgi:WhiB family redox-sensing transcriptional regulator